VINSIDLTPTGTFNLELFFELSPDLLCIAGYDGYFKRINPTVSKTLGYTKEELFAQPISSFIHPEDQDMTAMNREKLLRNTPLLHFENRYVTKSGETVWLSWTSMPIESESVVFAIAKIITHKKKQEDDRNALLASLTKVNQDLKNLNYTTSHDLRSPVSNLLSLFQVWDVSKIQDKEALAFINMLKLAAEDLKETLNGYVDVLNQKDAVNILVESLDLQECLNTVLHSLQSLIQSTKTHIHIDFSALPIINFNKGHLKSIFMNLVTNSIKYARPGHHPDISISSHIENGVKQLIYADKGLGFDMEKVKHRIFGLHQTFQDAADSKGIGLYLIYNHVTSLGGKISVESAVNEGARFLISFKD
jgi:PAS domain S-box-containing protein